MNPDAPAAIPEASSDITTHPEQPTATGNRPTCCCATSVGQVEAAWGLVYQRYAEMGLIDENPFRIHASAASVGRHACVLWGPEGPVVGYTMTLIGDNPIGLALDSVYPRELDDMRRRGDRLLEVGMLADRRHSTARSMAALFRTMRWAVYYALYNGVTDAVAGVHPRHAHFYAEYYGFRQIAPERNYPMVRDHPVVLLHLPLMPTLFGKNPPRGLADALRNPVPESAFANRFLFESEQLRASRIAGFMQAHYGIDACKATALATPFARDPYAPAAGPSAAASGTHRLLA